MSVDFNSTPMNNPTTNESDTPMFAAVPAWERNRKRGMFGGKARSAAPRATGVDTSPEPAPAAPLDSADTIFAAAPAYATRPAKKGRAGAPLAIAAGIVAIGGLAAAGWYAAQPHDAGVAQLTPGTASTAAPIAPVAPPEMAANLPATPAPAPLAQPAVAPAKAVTPPARTGARVAAVRTRPAPVSRSAEQAGVNTAATLPAAPQPYSGSGAPASAPADVTTSIPAPAAMTPAPVNPMTPPAAATPPVATPPQ